MRRRTLAGAVCGALMIGGLVPAGATAVHTPEPIIREVFAGSTAAPGAAFVELQLTAAGDNQVAFGGGSSVDFYNAAGTASIASGMFVSDPTNGDNQRTILAGCPLAAATFGVTLDLVLTCGVPSPSNAGGSACFDSIPFGSLDCVGWGTGVQKPGTSSFGTAAPAIPDGMSLTRSMCAGDPALLELTDDTNNSAADFAATAPTPTPNSVPPPAMNCDGGPLDTDGDGVPDSSDLCPTVPATTANGCPTDADADGVPDNSDQCPTVAGPASNNGCPIGSTDTKAPQTNLGKTPPKRTQRTTAVFKFSADESSTFQCKLDSKPLRNCSSPKRYRHLKPGHHGFQVVATDSAGNSDPSAARYRWTVLAG